jgi:predicted nucleotidyltransferase component of viral defense system
MRDYSASVRSRLKNRMKETGEALNFIELQYVQERFLFRLSESEHRDKFILKGGTLFYIWAGMKYRPTKDLDFMFLGSLNRQNLVDEIRDICSDSHPEDGIDFVPESFTYEEIKEDHEYDGVRISFLAKIGSSKIFMKLDVCTGDKITPKPEENAYPKVLAEFSQPHLRTYPKETVIAEKVHAMISLDLMTSRMKDFFDVYILVTELEKTLDLDTLKEAMTVTFEHRGLSITETPQRVWQEYFYNDQSKQNQWKAFMKRNKISGGLTLEHVCETLGNYLNPIINDFSK